MNNTKSIKAVRMWSDGSNEAFETFVDKMAPQSIGAPASSAFLQSTIKTARSRDGFLFDANKLEESKGIFSQYTLWKVAKMTEIASIAATEAAIEASDTLDKKTKKLMSQFGNTFSSIKASSKKIQGEASTIAGQYERIIEILNSKGFQDAMVNAERMAAALESVSALSNRRITMRIEDEKNQAGGEAD